MPNSDEMRKMMNDLIEKSNKAPTSDDKSVYSSDLANARKLDDKDVSRSLKLLLSDLRACKPNDRSELDRRYAVTITKMEDVFAYFSTYILGRE